jgi:imidazolonepropionase-like amidohydrolase
MKRSIVLALVLLGLAAAPAAAQVIAIENAKVHVAPGQVVEDATVIVRDGAIAAVGPGVAVPAGAQRIDAAGKVVTAGFVDAATRLGMVEVDLEASTQEGVFKSDGSDVVHAAYRVEDGYNPQSVAIPITRAGGVTSVVVAPHGALVSGSGAWFMLGGDSTPARMTVKAPVAMYASLGEGAKGAAEGSRGIALERLRELLDDAADYRRRRGNFERNQTREYAAERLDLEALQPVLRGDIPLVLRAHRASDIRAALRLADEVGIRVVIEGGTEAWVVAEDLATAGVPVILDPSSNLPGSFDRTRVRDDAARVLADAGVVVAFSSLGDSANVRNLRQLAGIAVGNGATPEQALAAVTTAPARIFGITGRGEVKRGQAADLVVWSGDPFELSSHAEHVIIGGVAQPLENRQTLLRDRYRTLR